MSFQNTTTVFSRLSDFHKLVLTVLKINFTKNIPKEIIYRDYKNFDSFLFNDELQYVLQNYFYSNSFSNFDSPIENNISNTLPALPNSPSLPSTRSFVAQNGNANIESTRSWSPLTRIRERPLRYRHSIGSPNLSTYHRPIIIAEDSLSTQSQPAQLVDTVPTHFQLPIATSHVSLQSVRTEPQILIVQIVPINQGEPMSNMPSEERYLQVLQETNAVNYK